MFFRSATTGTCIALPVADKLSLWPTELCTSICDASNHRLLFLIIIGDLADCNACVLFRYSWSLAYFFGTLADSSAK